jgi:hypothetical protein
MRPLSILLALTAAIGVSASPYFSTNLNRPDRPEIHAYFDKAVPVALDVLRDDIGGPSIGADVNPRLYPPITYERVRC